MKKLAKWFYKQSFLLQLILLFIPVVNWVIEISVRWTAYFKHGGLLKLILAIVAIPGGLLFGWVDVVWLLLTRHLLLGKI